MVYKVIHHAKERVEALKVLFGKTPIRAAYFQNEVHLIAKLRHANIATLYEAHLGTPPYYTMEFVEGEQLDDYVRSRHLPLVDRIQLVKTVAEAVGYAHEQGVVHRDIKPQNILIGTDGQPHIIDFGIAKKLVLREVSEDDPPSSPEGVMGTFGYIAPEQIAGEQVDERADIYALGALLYHCITGDPAKFANCSERLTQILYERQVTRAADLAAIIARCVHPVPEEHLLMRGADRRPGKLPHRPPHPGPQGCDARLSTDEIRCFRIAEPPTGGAGRHRVGGGAGVDGPVLASRGALDCLGCQWALHRLAGLPRTDARSDCRRPDRQRSGRARRGRFQELAAAARAADAAAG